MIDVSKLDFRKAGGLVPAVIQDSGTKRVLMLGYMNEDAVRMTLKKRQAVFWSRSKRRLWRKGEESGNTLEVVSIVADCDGDTLLIGVKPDGPTCHTGTRSCFDSEDTR